MAFELHIKAIAQDVLGVALIDAKTRQIRLIDQEPADVAPEEVPRRRMRIELFVGVLVMAAVNRKFGDLSTAQGASSGLAAQLRQAQDDAAALQKRIDDLTAENQKLRAAPQPVSTQTPPVTQTPTATATGLSTTDAQRLKNLDALAAGYRTYAEQEDAIVGSQGEDRGRMRTIGLRDQFLSSLDGMYRGLLERIHGYDSAFIKGSLAQGKEEGRQAALQQAMTIVLGLSRQPSADQRKSYLDAQVKNASADPALRAFLNNLQVLAGSMK